MNALTAFKGTIETIKTCSFNKKHLCITLVSPTISRQIFNCKRNFTFTTHNTYFFAMTMSHVMLQLFSIIERLNRKVTKFTTNSNTATRERIPFETHKILLESQVLLHCEFFQSVLHSRNYFLGENHLLVAATKKN